MENLNNVPSTGTFGNSVQKINSNFDLIVNAINSLEYQTTRSKGILSYGTNPATAFPNAVSGDWCMILSEGNVFPATIKTYNGSTWSGSGTWNPEGIDLTQYAKTTDMNTAIANSLAQATARMGYGVCTVSGTSLEVSIPNFILPTSGGTIHIKMSAAGTGASTLSINGTTAKTLWYNGAAVSAQNTWEAGEIISVFYDGTRFMASNSQGGGGKAEKIKYDNSQSGLSADNVQEALDEVVDNVPKLYDNYGQNKDGAIMQKALDDIADERDEVVMRALLDLDERSGGGGYAGNALNYTKKNFYLFGASIEALACVSDPGKTAESLIPTAPGGWATYFKQAPYVKELYDYAAKAGAYSTCTGSATFTLNYNTGDSSKNIYWNQINLAIYNYLKGTVPAPDVVIMTTGGNDIQWQNNRDPQVIFSQTADDVLCTNLNSFTFTKYSDADILSENISSNEVRTKCLTFASSWRYYVEMIYSYWPSTQIIFLGNLYTRGGDIPRNEVENTFNRQNDLAEACCRKMGIPIIRGDYEGGRWNIYEMVKHIAAGGSPDDDYGTGKLHTWGWTYDGYHLTNEGAKMYGEYMISKVGSLLRYRYNV